MTTTEVILTIALGAVALESLYFRWRTALETRFYLRVIRMATAALNSEASIQKTLDELTRIAQEFGDYDNN